MSISVRTNVKTLARIEKQIQYVQKRISLAKDKNFKKYLEDKFIEVIKDEAQRSLPGGQLSQEYIANNKVRETTDGFIIYNDTTVATDSKGYGGTFSIAMLFEYGSGIVGQNNAKLGAWQYNVNGHEKGWYYFKDEKFNWTSGVEGREIYRNSLAIINSNLQSWTDSYLEGK